MPTAKGDKNFEIIDLTIDSLSYNGGRGVGRFEGVVVFVPQTAPQDVVRARVVRKKSRFWEAELQEILQPSPLRRTPPCPVASECGGCSWQHVTYSAQITQKQQILNSSLRALKKYGDWRELPFLPSIEEFHYRNRIQLQVQNDQLGFFAKRSHRIVTFDECWIAEPPLNARLRQLKGEGVRSLTTNKVELALDENLQVALVQGERDPSLALFSQVNRAQNEVLKVRLLELVSQDFQWAMDLFAGSGNLSIPLAQRLQPVTVRAVELSASAVARAQAAAPTPGAIEWSVGDVGRVLAKLPRAPGDGLIVLDPPRIGCDSGVIEQLVRHAPKQILYVSCNPTTFARDTEALITRGAYRLESVQGLDMFPQTEHVELIASLCAAT